VFVEGGGDRRDTLARCREGFSNFFRKVLANRMPRVSPCGGRRQAHDAFVSATGAGRARFCVLLVDSEGPVGAGQAAWDLLGTHGMPRPAGAADDQAHLMVQCMESWFLADLAVLADFYGPGFHPGTLPGNPRVEEVPRADVQAGLTAATRGTPKGAYHKGEHSYLLLGGIDPARVRAVAPFCQRLLATLEARCS
jgi:hypothetical protein